MLLVLADASLLSLSLLGLPLLLVISAVAAVVAIAVANGGAAAAAGVVTGWRLPTRFTELLNSGRALSERLSQVSEAAHRASVCGDVDVVEKSLHTEM